MNRHVFLDNLTATMGALAAGKQKFFSRSSNSPSFKDFFSAIDLEIPFQEAEGIVEVQVNIAGIPDAAYKVEKWLGRDYPTIIYHHGNNEKPFDYRRAAKNTFYNIFVKARGAIDANLIVVRAPFHNLSIGEYQSSMTELEKFMGMISASVKLNEGLVAALRRNSRRHILTCGISLGGWVTNLHRCYFNSSDSYVPLLAGACLGELFLESSYRKLTGSQALMQPEVLRNRLNFRGDYEKVVDKNVFPLLARYDQFIVFNTQLEGYRGHEVATLEKGHVTAAVNSLALRNHVLKVLAQQ